MSHYSKPSYRNNPPVPDSDSDRQEPSSPHLTPSPPSSAEFSSDPAVLVNPSVTSHSSNPVDLDLVFPSTSVEFNLTRSHNNPTVSSSKVKEDHTVTPIIRTTQPVFTPPNSQPVTTHTMSPTYTGINALPIQGKRDAPRTFKGSYDKVEEFLRTMDKLFARFEVTSDSEKVEAILPYCSIKVQDY